MLSLSSCRHLFAQAKLRIVVGVRAARVERSVEQGRLAGNVLVEMISGSRISQRRFLAAVAASIVVLTGSIASVPIIGFVATAIWLAALATRYLTAGVAIVAGFLLPALAIALVITWSYVQPIAFTHLITAALVLLVWLATFVTPRGAGPWFRLDVPTISAGVPVAVTVAAMFLGGSLSTDGIAWMLPGDAQNNTIEAREIIRQNGADPSVQSIPALSQVLMAAAVARSVGFNVHADSFATIVQVQAIVLVGTWAFASLLFGLIAVRESKGLPVWARVVAAVMCASLPLTWFVLGFSLAAGFFNAPLALIGLAMTWLVWREQETIGAHRQWAIVTLLALVTLFTAIAWVPLAVLPGLFLLAAIRESWRSADGVRSLSKWPVVASIVALAVYGSFIILPSYLANSKGLTSAGSMVDLPNATVLVVFALAVLVSLFVATERSGGQSIAAGIWLYLWGTGLALLLVVAPSFATGFAWNYYPRKLVWFATFVLMVILAALAFGTRSLLRRKRIWHWLLAASSILVLLVVGLRAVPFMQSGTFRAMPFLAIAVSGTGAQGTISAVAQSVGTSEIRLEFDQDDVIVNQWVFKWAARLDGGAGDEIAYLSIQNPTDACGAASAFGGGATLRTKSASVADEVMQECGELFTSVVGVQR